MRILRISPYTYGGTHVKNIIEVSKTSDFSTILYTEESTTLNYIVFKTEPTPNQSYWVRVKRVIVNNINNQEEIMLPTQPKEVKHGLGTDTIESVYVEPLTIYVNDKPNMVTGATDELFKYNLDSFVVNNILSIRLGELRSDIPEIAYTNILVTSGGKTMYHKVNDGVQLTYDLDISSWELDGDVSISAAYTNITGVTGKFSTVKLYTGKKFSFVSHNVFPKVRLDLNSFSVLMSNGETFNRIVVRNAINEVVKEYTTNSVVFAMSDGLVFNSSYKVTVHYTVDDVELTSAPFHITTELTTDNPTFDKMNVTLKPYSSVPYFTSVETVIPDSAISHIDNLNGAMVSLVESVGTNYLYFYTLFDFVNGEYSTKDVLVAEINLDIQIADITKFVLKSFTNDTFVLETEDATSRHIYVYKYDILRGTCNLIHRIFNEITISECDKLVVMSESTFMYTTTVAGSVVLNTVILDDTDNSFVTSRTTVPDVTNLDILYSDSLSVVISANETYRYTPYDNNLDLIDGKIGVPTYDISFKIPSGEMMFVNPDNIYVLKDYVLTPYGVNPTGKVKVIRNQDNTISLDDGLVNYLIGS